MHILNDQEKPSLDELMHFGVKGMQWGVRKDRSPREVAQARLKKVERKQQRINADLVVRGHELHGWAVMKGAKHPSRRAARSIVLRGAAETAIIVGGGLLYISKLRLLPRTRLGGKVAVGILAGKVGKTRIDELRALRARQKHLKLVKEREALVKQLRIKD